MLLYQREMLVQKRDKEAEIDREMGIYMHHCSLFTAVSPFSIEFSCSCV